MKPVERLNEYLKFKNLKPGSVDRIIEVGNGYIGKQIKASASIGSDILERIFLNFPDLNPAWLFTGMGNMINTDSTDTHARESVEAEQLSKEDQAQLLQLEIELKEIEITHLKKKLEILNSLRKPRIKSEL